MYDQLTQHGKVELLADIRMAGAANSMESYRKAHAYGKKKTAENVHRARNSHAAGDRGDGGRAGTEVPQVEEGHRLLEGR